MATGGADQLNAVVIGATGATGKCLVGSLLKAKVDRIGLVSIPGLLLRKEGLGSRLGLG